MNAHKYTIAGVCLWKDMSSKDPKRENEESDHHKKSIKHVSFFFSSQSNKLKEGDIINSCLSPHLNQEKNGEI